MAHSTISRIPGRLTLGEPQKTPKTTSHKREPRLLHLMNRLELGPAESPVKLTRRNVVKRLITELSLTTLECRAEVLHTKPTGKKTDTNNLATNRTVNRTPKHRNTAC